MSFRKIMVVSFVMDGEEAEDDEEAASKRGLRARLRRSARAGMRALDLGLMGLVVKW